MPFFLELVQWIPPQQDTHPTAAARRRRRRRRRSRIKKNKVSCQVISSCRPLHCALYVLKIYLKKKRERRPVACREKKEKEKEKKKKLYK